MKYLVLDSETNIKNVGDDAIGKNKADPFHPDNNIVWMGFKTQGGEQVEVVNHKTGTFNVPKNTNLLVGQNIKFDLLHTWLWKDEMRRWIYHDNIHIWCTQLAEYLLTGQQHQWASLDQLAVKYDGTVKDSKIKEYWDAGVDTEDIPKSEIVPYLTSDVENTELVFLGQLTKAHKMGMLPLIMSQMEALLATIEMEYNGMKFNKSLADKLALTTRHEADLEFGLLAKKMEDVGISNPNPSSTAQVALFLFGGKYVTRGPAPVLDDDGVIVKIKSGPNKGTVKTKLVDTDHTIGQLVRPKEEWKGKSGYNCNNDILIELERAFAGCTDMPALTVLAFIKSLRHYRGLMKDCKTYYEGFAKLVWPDGFIHGHFNHCTTNTGRLSSSAPNLQNVTTQDKS